MADQGWLVRRYTATRLHKWKEEKNESCVKGELAHLRREIGKPPGASPAIWGILFDGFPEELMSKNGDATWAEWAVSTALCAYALHQQGNDISKNDMNKEGQSLGKAVRSLAPMHDEENLERIRKRFNIFATAADIQECAYYLRGLVQMLRANSIPLDYPTLAYDLYEFQTPNGAPRVRLRWGQDFYRITKSEEREENNND